MNTSVRLMLCLQLVLIFTCLITPAASISCYQQTYTPGQTQLALSNNNLPRLTCPPTSNSCFKMVCFGTTYYVIRGCLDFTLPQYNCQTLSTQCPGATGQCYTCNGNNCNGSAKNTAKIGILLTLTAIVYFFVEKKLNDL